MEHPRYRDFLNELARGGTYGIFVDETCSPGHQDTPHDCDCESKSWVAVVVAPNIMPKVLDQFPRALESLRKMTGAEQYDFTDIYTGRRQFTGVDLQLCLAHFEFMAYLFSTYRFPIIVQTFDTETSASNPSGSNGRLPASLPPFDFARERDAALFLLLVRLKWLMEQTRTYPRIKACVFIDEGFKNNGIALNVPTFEKVFRGGLVCFGQSSSILPIHLASFAAFALNHTRPIERPNKNGTLDNRVLEILAPVAFNYVNSNQKIVPLTNTDDGSNVLLADTRISGLP